MRSENIAVAAGMPRQYDDAFRVADAPAAERAAFYRKTYITAGLAFVGWIGATYALFASGFAYVVARGMGSVSWLLILGLFMAAQFVGGRLTFAQDRGKQYLGLGMYIVAYALIFAPLLVIVQAYTSMTGNAILMPAVLATGTVFAALTATVFFTRTDFSFLRGFVIFGSIFAIGAIVVFTVTGANVGSWFAIGMIVLMSGSILYETHAIKEKFDTAQHIGAGAMIFASFMTLLWYVIQLFMKRD
jgi:FtsH-binding integral membrane protein